MYKTMIVDAMNLAYKINLKLPELKSSSGESSDVVFGFLNSLNAFNKKFGFRNIIIVWDSRRNFRKEIEDTYKNRPKPDISESFYSQITLLKKELPKLGFCCLEVDGYESDDIIGALCREKKYLKNIKPVLILSSDNDLFQLVSKDIHMYTKEIMTKEKVEEKIGFPLELFVYYKAIVGCTTDTVKGIIGYGEKKAKSIFEECNNNINKVFQVIEEDGKADEFDWALKLVYLPYNMNNFNLDVLQTKINYKKFLSFCNKYDIKKIANITFLNNMMVRK